MVLRQQGPIGSENDVVDGVRIGRSGDYSLVRKHRAQRRGDSFERGSIGTSVEAEEIESENAAIIQVRADVAQHLDGKHVGRYAAAREAVVNDEVVVVSKTGHLVASVADNQPARLLKRKERGGGTRHHGVDLDSIRGHAVRFECHRKVSCAQTDDQRGPPLNIV